MKKFSLQHGALIEDDDGHFVYLKDHLIQVAELLAKIEALTPTDDSIQMDMYGHVLWEDPKRGELQARLGALKNWLLTSCGCCEGIQKKAFDIIDNRYGPGANDEKNKEQAHCFHKFENATCIKCGIKWGAWGSCVD